MGLPDTSADPLDSQREAHLPGPTSRPVIEGPQFQARTKSLGGCGGAADASAYEIGGGDCGGEGGVGAVDAEGSVAPEAAPGEATVVEPPDFFRRVTAYRITATMMITITATSNHVRRPE